MKKIAFFAAALLAFAGCQKNEIQDNASQQKLITRTFTVDSEDARAKSFFDPLSESVKLDRNESIAVAWAPVSDKGWKINGLVEAKRNDNIFSYSHAQVDTANSYNYFFVMPYRGTSNINKNSKSSSIYVKLDAIQHPTATSFDPLQDYVIGQPVFEATEEQTSLSSSDLKLKRLFALVRVTLRDGDNFFDGDALKSVSIGFPWTSTDNKDKKNNLVSLVYLEYATEFSNSGPSGYANVYSNGTYNYTQVSPTVTAEYSEGLPAVSTAKGNTYTVWYVTLPVEKAEGTTLTVTAQSATQKVTREISLPKDMKLTAGIINDISINITGDGYVTEDLVDENDYWSIYNAGQDIVAGGITINKSTHSATLLEGENATRKNLQAGGVIFFDGNGKDIVADAHLKPIKGSILIGRYKDSQPTITMNSSYSVYLDAGNLIFKNINFEGTTTANRLFVISAPVASDYAVIEDCSITANKTVLGYSSATPANAIKSITLNNCTIKMAGTDANYAVMNIAASKLDDFSVYDNIEEFAVTNCVIYAETASANSAKCARRPIMDLGNNGVTSAKDAWYYIPLKNAKLTVKDNTLYNINANSNCLVRAYYAGSAEITNNVLYTDISTFGTKDTGFKASYMFGLYNDNGGDHGTYSITGNYSYCYIDASQTDFISGRSNGIKWGYSYSGTTNETATKSPAYITSPNKNPAAGTVKNQPFSSVNLTNGYFPVNTANTNGVTGASYESKPWVK